MHRCNLVEEPLRDPQSVQGVVFFLVRVVPEALGVLEARVQVQVQGEEWDCRDLGRQQPPEA